MARFCRTMSTIPTITRHAKMRNMVIAFLILAAHAAYGNLSFCKKISKMRVIDTLVRAPMGPMADVLSACRCLFTFSRDF
jgi:hypothetical protein